MGESGTTKSNRILLASGELEKMTKNLPKGNLLSRRAMPFSVVLLDVSGDGELAIYSEGHSKYTLEPQKGAKITEAILGEHGYDDYTISQTEPAQGEVLSFELYSMAGIVGFYRVLESPSLV